MAVLEQGYPILVYHNRISGSAASRYIVHGRCEIEDWPNPERTDRVNVVQAASVAHIEHTIGIVRITGNSPFI